MTKAFDPHHTRVLFPGYGAQVDAAMRAKGLSAVDIAEKLQPAVDPSAVRGWRRGFGRNDPSRTVQLEGILGIALDMSEPRPSQAMALIEQAVADQKAGKMRFRKKPAFAAAGKALGISASGARHSQAPGEDPILRHVEAIALLRGYLVTFTPIA